MGEGNCTLDHCFGLLVRLPNADEGLRGLLFWFLSRGVQKAKARLSSMVQMDGLLEERLV